jgi:hypothetical protein
MKSHANKAIALSGGAVILVLTVGFGGADLSPNGATTTRSSSIAPAFRPPRLPQDVSLSTQLDKVMAGVLGGTRPVGQAHAGGPPCVTDSPDPCLPIIDDTANAPSPPRVTTMCRPAGIFGQHCYRRLLP